MGVLVDFISRADCLIYVPMWVRINLPRSSCWTCIIGLAFPRIFINPLIATGSMLQNISFSEGIQTSNVQQVIMDGPLCDEGTLLQVLYHELTFDREPSLHGCLAMREDSLPRHNG